ncbi:MAG: hypothetical protein BWY15_01457 [Firmicutes bacterium ADurb.Bin193]|nr:MAG: hypothetical protein BWY15_01457 [Firmicutes bacterium ADurb.Bin193]
MISIIMGSKGSGKTKAFIDKANSAAVEETGTVVFIMKGDRHKFDLKSSVRFIDTSDFELDSYKVFYGFICGIISRDYDITHIFIDSVTKIVNSDLEKLSTFLGYIEKISEQFNIKFTLTVSSDTADAPDGLHKYLISY